MHWNKGRLPLLLPPSTLSFFYVFFFSFCFFNFTTSSSSGITSATLSSASRALGRADGRRPGGDALEPRGRGRYLMRSDDSDHTEYPTLIRRQHACARPAHICGLIGHGPIINLAPADRSVERY